MKTYKTDLLIHEKFPAMRSVNLFCYIRKMNICMIEENSMKHGRYY